MEYSRFKKYRLKDNFENIHGYFKTGTKIYFVEVICSGAIKLYRFLSECGRSLCFLYPEERVEEVTVKQEGVSMNANEIKRGDFIVGSIGVNGLSFANHPKIHKDSLSAKLEAERLAKTNQGKKFVVVEVKGVVEVANVVWQ